eukprot:TRINITY_DN20781_c0_g1_i2.p1 TRINITY_DN20781_c0_g1~~TRINITY_DN20781_c0_g1_i2.p1  ORF type:complete len:406 (-),score=92.53 TRINITY_DN20781_c0_g1_i2:291-1508(-)
MHLSHRLAALSTAALCSFATAGDMKLTLFPEDLAKDRGAQCLDHTPAGYYSRVQDPDKWLIFLEGGGLCVEPIDCIMRGKTSLGSSKNWDPNNIPEGHGPTSTTDLNPFANFSHVWVPYCSGDTWLGNSKKGHLTLLGLQMSGHLIIETLIDYLVNTTSFGSATQVVLSGSSAGGIGTFHHTDWLAGVLAKNAQAKGAQPPRVVGMPIEGMFFPEKLPVLFEQFALGNTEPDSSFESKYLNLLFDSWFQPDCVAAAKSEGFSVSDCFNVAKSLLYTKTPLFICMNRFDELIIQELGLCPGSVCKSDASSGSVGGRYIRFYGARMNSTVADLSQKLPHTAWFVPSVFQHDGNFYEGFYDKEIRIQNATLKSAIEGWYWDGRPTVVVEDTCNSDGPCLADATSFNFI